MDMENDRLTKETARLAAHQSEMDVTNMDTLLSTKERQLRELDDDISNINDEMSKLSLQGDTRARLALKQGDRDAKVAAARSIFEQCKDDVAQGLGVEPTLDRLDKDLRALLEKQLLEISAIQNRLDQANRDLSAAETLLSITQTSITDKRNEADALQQAIQAVCPDTSLPDEINKVDGDIVDLRGKLSSLNAAELLYSRFVKKADTNKHCPLCIRQFAQDDELTQFIRKVNKRRNEHGTS
jgi:DNA repair protein RAD50